MTKEDFIQEGFNVVETENNENKLLHFLKEHYPNVIKDGEINLNELKAIAGLPIDEKVNGYGLNFVGRNFARAKYAQKATKELKLNTDLSKNIDITQNLVLKGDNLDSLKILKSYYTGKIKCIYIDPPYNTKSDEFIYPDKFTKEETEVLGLANLSDDDFARMDFSFKTKKSHNGWLSFMYPRLLLARDLLRDDGVIFISIDDNEQANLKLLCDDVFGEENFVATFPWRKRTAKSDVPFGVSQDYEWIICYAKSNLFSASIEGKGRKYYETEDFPNRPWRIHDMTKQTTVAERPNSFFTMINPKTGEEYPSDANKTWRITKDTFSKYLENSEIIFPGDYDFLKISKPVARYFKDKDMEKDGKDFGRVALSTKLPDDIGMSQNGTKEVKNIFDDTIIFSFPKPSILLKYLFSSATNENDIILDFFAGSGTTGHAVMQLNAEDGGNRKFILCQIDEHIKKDKPAYKFCVENKLPPVISSITIERLKRAGEKISKEIEAEAGKPDLFEENKKRAPDIGFKVFDSVEAPKLELDGNGQISILFNDNDALSRIYNMIFTVGLDEPAQKPEEVIKDCIYKIGNNYYITNSERISKDNFAHAIKNGKVFIDGWTASLSGTLQNYKEDVKIVF